ncbi:MAG: four helix bundle protein [Bacteroidetes bacterium]|nr:four helix bundle protein [Bacteroidota bacterium]
MTENELKTKTKSIAIAVGKLCEKLISNKINNTYSGQILRSSASIGANYRAACRAKSMKDFINKLRIVEEEADETLYFLELLAAFNEEYKGELRTIYRQTESVLKIIVASIRTSIKKLENNDRKINQKGNQRSDSKE